jgi:tetratricopeptide (TPR) repeat protein
VLWPLVRMVGAVAVVAGGTYTGFAVGGRPGAIIGFAIAAIVALWFWLLLPRAAHRHFRAGALGPAMRRYRALRLVTFDPERRGAIDVSLAACHLAADDLSRAAAVLGRIDAERVGEATRSALLNNRAYATLRADGDAAAALGLADQAIALRPHVAGFHHTRAAALLALDRTDEAIRILDALWHDLAGDEASAVLEAERCYDLGRAWQRKGHADYARDYFERARRAAPTSRWSARATEQLPHGELGSDARLSELLEA